MSDKELRELDAWIAVNVMGWIPCRGDYWRGAHNKGKFNCAIKEADSWAFEYEGGNVCDDSGKTYCGNNTYQWQPTSDNDCAFQVLEKCAERLCEQDEEEAVSIGMEVPYFVVEKTNNHKSLRAEAPTLPLAICLLAKRLYGKEL